MAVTLAVMTATPGCSAAPGRTEARATLVQQLVDAGLTRTVAGCVVDAFFATKTDEQLKAFYKRPTLTEDEQAEFATFGAQCGA
jgi:hypothetical protein